MNEEERLRRRRPAAPGGSAYSTHLPALLAMVQRTREGKGPILELGAGVHSTPALHALAEAGGRRLVTVDTSKAWAERFKHLASDFHDVLFVDPSGIQDVIATETSWAVALVDHKPPAARGRSVKLLAERARFVVVHDTEPDGPHYAEYGYEEAFRRYSFISHWTVDRPWTTVLSRFETPGVST